MLNKNERIFQRGEQGLLEVEYRGYQERSQDDSPQDAEKNQLPALRLFPKTLMAFFP